MHLIVEVVTSSPDRPPAGSPLRAEVRDTSLADAPAETVGASAGQVRGELGTWLDTVEVDFDHPTDRCTIWVHVDVDGDGRVSKGDYVTMMSYPVPPHDGDRVTVEVRRV
jgi:hypothetical protein